MSSSEGPIWRALAFGFVGLLFGYFPPLFLSPEYEQGPLIGIVITGPLGLFLGWLLEKFYRSRQFHWMIREGTSLIVCGAFVGLVIVASRPGRELAGMLIQGSVSDCRPVQSGSEAVVDGDAGSEQRLKPPEPEETVAVPESMKTESAAVLTLRISRLRSVYVWRSGPRKDGRTTAGEWRDVDRRNQYLARFLADDCAAYSAGGKDFYWSPLRAKISGGRNVDLASYLGLEELELIPARFRQWVEPITDGAPRDLE